jgi:hypothetical protein
MQRSSPYLGIEKAARWRDSVASRSPESINPHFKKGFRILPEHRIASAGSCFAQRISQALRTAGYNYFVTEPGAPILTDAERADLGFGLYSARYGNVYTVAQLLQLFLRAFGRFEPAEPVWRNQQDLFVDPFRSGVQPSGFESEAACLWDRRSHLKAVRRLFEEMDVFIFTLGLTEGWKSAEDGAVFPNCPGSGHGGHYDETRHLFHNFGVNEVVSQLNEFIALLGEVNPACRIILTVSPVPLIATFESRHVLQSTVYSKSVLRVACEEVVRRHEHVTYFASYEIVTATGDSKRYFLDDRRDVSDDAVRHVLSCFAEQFMDAELRVSAAGTAASPQAPAKGPKPICDEDEILRAMAAHSAGSN